MSVYIYNYANNGYKGWGNSKVYLIFKLDIIRITLCCYIIETSQHRQNEGKT